VPKLGSSTAVFGVPKSGWLNTFWASIRNSRFIPSRALASENSFPSAMSAVKDVGERTLAMARGALPSAYIGGNSVGPGIALPGTHDVGTLRAIRGERRSIGGGHDERPAGGDAPDAAGFPATYNRFQNARHIARNRFSPSYREIVGITELQDRRNVECCSKFMSSAGLCELRFAHLWPAPHERCAMAL
jgi:hypothetical protein